MILSSFCERGPAPLDIKRAGMQCAYRLMVMGLLGVCQVWISLSGPKAGARTEPVVLCPRAASWLRRGPAPCNRHIAAPQPGYHSDTPGIVGWFGAAALTASGAPGGG